MIFFNKTKPNDTVLAYHQALDLRQGKNEGVLEYINKKLLAFSIAVQV
jgi:hypothetical protein